VGIVIAGVVVRIAPAGRALLFGDEFHSLRTLARGYTELLTEFGAHGSGLALPLMQRTLADLFGLNHWSIRLPAIAGGLATLALVYPLGRRLVGAPAAVVATGLVAANSALVFYSHFGRSYALASALALVLLYVLWRVVIGDRASVPRCAGCAILGALLPYLHLTTLGFIVPVGAGVVLSLALQKRHRDLGAVVAALALGGIVAFLLHLPAWDSLRGFADKRTEWSYFGSFGVLDVAALLAGSRSVAWVAVGGAAIASVWMGVRQGSRALPLVMACVGPGIALLVARPFGDAYAYSRYALVSVPAICLALGWLLSEIVERLLPHARLRPPLVVALGLAAAVALHVAGPRGVGHTPDGPHANTYFSLYALPAFDRPYEGASEFYHRIAREGGVHRVVEAPALTNRARHLYRGYWLLHRQETLLALFPEELPVIPDGPYVHLGDPSWRRDARADYLVLHLDPVAELERYWRFVYAADRDGTDPTEATLMERHGRFDHAFGKPSDWLRQRLRAELGDPFFIDESIEVWRLNGDGSR
jgi:hypothetical protein